MAYIEASDVNGLTTDTISIPTSTYDFITAQIDDTFTTQFKLLLGKKNVALFNKQFLWFMRQ